MKTHDWGEYYDKNEALYSRLASIVGILLQQRLDIGGIRYLSVTARLKEKVSVLEKIERKNYSDPKRQLTDFAGIRVVTYLPSQVDLICDLVRDFFDISKSDSVDKLTELGTDKVGYQSKHFICSLGKRRASLPEYEGVSSLKFEIQVRTILQHAWAELAHGSHKFSSRLPPKLQRKLNLHAGNLELVDIGLDEISAAIDEYSEDISRGDSHLLAEPINALSLQGFIKDRFPELEDSPTDILDRVVDEVRNYGIETVKGLDAVLDNDLKAALDTYTSSEDTVAGATRKILMANDLDRYFSVWDHHWAWMTQDTHDLLCERLGKKKVDAVLKAHGVKLEEE